MNDSDLTAKTFAWLEVRSRQKCVSYLMIRLVLIYSGPKADHSLLYFFNSASVYDGWWSVINTMTHCSPLSRDKYLLSLLAPRQISISPPGGVRVAPQYHKYNFIVWSIFSTTIQLAARSPGTWGDHRWTIFNIQPIYLTSHQREREDISQLVFC